MEKKPKIPRTVKSETFIAVTLTLIVFLAFTLNYALSASTVTIVPSSFVETASYTIWKDGVTYYAKNGDTGEVDYSGTNAATVIDTTEDALTSGGKIFLKAGWYNITTEILIENAYVNIEGAGRKTILETSEAINIINVNAISFQISNIQLKGSGESVPGQNGIYVQKAVNYVAWHDIYMTQIGDTCIEGAPLYGHRLLLSSCYFYDYYHAAIKWQHQGLFIEHCIFRALDHAPWGIVLNGAGVLAFNIQGSGIYDHNQAGIVLQNFHYYDHKAAYAAKITNCEILDNKGRAIQILNADGIMITNNRIINNNRDDSAAYHNIDLYNACYCLIEQNQFSANRRDHIYFDSLSKNNTVAFNYFMDYLTTTMIAGTIDASNTIQFNWGFTTENSGTTEASNDDWITHDLVGTPDIITLTIEETDANYCLQLKASNSTHFQIYLYDLTADTLETVDKTILWHAKYEP